MAAGGQDGHNADAIPELDGEKDLLRVLSDKEPTFAEVNDYLAKFRIACQNAIFHCFETGTETASLRVEAQLWEIHVKINNRFRRLLLRFRDDNTQKKRPVEKRKLQNHYLNFIKSSQRFYRGYIQHLVSRFDRIPELEKLARELKFENLSVEDKPEIPETLRKSVVLTCHATLIRLGDLSRYREMELVPPTKNRNWDRAVRYYKLADMLNPDSGMSHNQLAVIGLADGNHLQATYHLYRALSAREPYPGAHGNLQIEFRKVLSVWAKGELIASSTDEKATLISMFVYLHAQCYKGLDFPEHDELENEILSQMAVDLKELSLHPHLLQKFCLINIAAEAYANARRANEGENAADVEPARDAPLFFQRLNVKTFFTLLQILLSELECSVAANESERITPVAQCVLPALRHYSSWLLSNSGSLVCEDKDTLLYVQIKEFWKMYAGTLSLLTSSFDVPSLSDVGYLLHEDEDTLGFSPLVNDITWRRYVDERGHKKPRSDGVAEKLPAHIEMLFRVREFVIDGLDLVVQEKIPIILAENNETKLFVYKEEGLPQFSSPGGQQHRHTLSSTSIEREDIRPLESNLGTMEYANSQSASASISLAMNQMVDNLVESETTENCPPIEKTLSSTTWRDASLKNTNANNGISQQNENDDRADNSNCAGTGTGTFNSYSPIIEPAAPQSYSPRPALPSILNTPFAPQPGEALSPATRPSTAIRQGDQYHPVLRANHNGAFSPAQDFPQQQQYMMGFQNNLQLPSTPNDYSYTTSNLSPTQTQTPGIPYNQGGAGGYATRQPPPGLPFNGFLNTTAHQYNERGFNQPSGAFYQYSSYDPISSVNSKGSHLGAGVIGQTPPSGQGSGG
ncbi:hypothetical protein GX51_01143 [Blastomyces parvus]|uniref:Nonsense-mediated mRNA decay factor n=1 Tax=Blastomyces parvus TaxID=2060905 RepID=A0A2B7XIM9_9EURO|nr:hypothetical protein GX51_01143 [Blastomyces parvus]